MKEPKKKKHPERTSEERPEGTYGAWANAWAMDSEHFQATEAAESTRDAAQEDEDAASDAFMSKYNG